LVTFVTKQNGFDAFFENLNFAFDKCKVQMSLLDGSDGAKKGWGFFSKIFIFRKTEFFSFLFKKAMNTKKIFPLQFCSR
jgi:hypothetical protein